MAEQPPRLKAFLSYSEADEAAAQALRRRLERFTVPRALRAGHGKRLGPFHPTQKSDNGPAEAEYLAEADQLIVCCGPTTPESERVNADIDTFIRVRGHEHVIMILLDGDPREALPARLRGREPITADFRAEGDGQEQGLLQLAAALLRVDAGALRDRQAGDDRMRLRIKTGVTIMLAVAVAGIGAGAALIWQERQRAEIMAREAIDVAGAALAQAEELSPADGADVLGAAEARLAAMFETGVHSQELTRQQAALLVRFADLYDQRGDVERARERAQAALELYGVLPDADRQSLEYVRALALVSQGEVAEGRTPEAINFAQRAVDAARIALVESPDGRRGNAALADALQRLGDLQMRASRPQEAIEPYSDAIPALELLRDQSPDDDEATANLIAGLERLGRAQAASARGMEARDTFERVVALSRERLAGNPRSGPARSALGDALDRYGRTIVDQGEPAQAREPLLESLAIARGLAALQPDDPVMQRAFSQRLIYTTTVLAEMGRASPDLMEEAIGAARTEVRSNPTNLQSRATLATIIAADAARLERAGEFTDARTAWYEVVQLRRGLVTATSDDTQRGYASGVADAFEHIARANVRLSEQPAALAAYNEAIRARRAAINGDPENRPRRAALAETLHTVGLLRLQAEYLVSARAAFDEAARLRIALAEETPTDDAIALKAMDSLLQLATVQAEDNPTDARRNLQAASSVLERVSEASPNNNRLPRYRSAIRRLERQLDAAETAANIAAAPPQ
jgi:tetratricopeptide (TPR) repeat protein